MSQADPEPDPGAILEDLPPSAVLVYRVLDEEGPLTQQEISESAYLPTRTTRHALGKLDDAGLITTEPAPDARQKLYSAN